MNYLKRGPPSSAWDDPFESDRDRERRQIRVDMERETSEGALEDRLGGGPFGCFGDSSSYDDSSDDYDDDRVVVGGSRTSADLVADPVGRVPPAAAAAAAAPAAPPESKKKRRDESCGVLSFHHGTEEAMLAHARNSVAALSLPPPASTRSSDTNSNNNKFNEQWEGSPEDIASTTVLSAVDEFCYTRHWMMNVGPEKGDILSETLRQSAEEAMASQLGRPAADAGRFVCVELGTYCGYAAVLLGRSLRAAASAVLQSNKKKKDGCGKVEEEEQYEQEGDGRPLPPRINFRLYTVEVNPAYAAISRELIQLARLDDIITIVEIPLEVSIIDTEDAAADAVSNKIWKDEAKLRKQVRRFSLEHSIARLPQIDFLFIDHDKDMYLPDLLRLEREGLVRAGSTCVADNVIFANIDDYVQYVKKLAVDEIVETETIYSKLEYADEESDHDDEDEDHEQEASMFCDGMEVTHYLRSPLADEQDWLVRSAPRFAAMKVRSESAKKLAPLPSKQPIPKGGSVRWNSTST